MSSGVPLILWVKLPLIPYVKCFVEIFIGLFSGSSTHKFHWLTDNYSAKMKEAVVYEGDYHDSMNHETFLAWFEKQLLPNIPPTSLIIMDNASHHSKIQNKAPTRSCRKSDIIQWLEENNIPHDPTHTKSELLHQVKRNKNRQVYIIDKIANEHGHKVVRLPPYHCHLNPIELVWAQVKGDVRMNNSNGNQTLHRVEQITKEAIAKVTANNWLMCVNHTQKIEQEYRERQQ